jgi:hypothetical protein
VLVKLATQFPEQLLENPIFDILLLENPNLLNELPVGTRRSLLKREKCPVSFLEWLAKDEDEGVQLALAMNPNTPRHVLKNLAKGSSKRVASAARKHVNFPASGRSNGRDSGDELSKALTLERLPESEEAVAARMLTWLPCVGDTNDRQVPRNLGTWARAQMEALPLASSPYSDAAALRDLAGSHRDDIRRAVAKNSSAPADVIARLAADPTTEVRLAVAKRSDASEKVLRDLAIDADAEVRAAVAANRMVPNDVLAKLARDKREGVRWQVARNRATPVEVLGRLAQDKSVGVRYQVAAHPHTPQPILDQFANGNIEDLRLIVARNPATRPDTLARLAKDNYKTNLFFDPTKLRLVFNRREDTFIVRLQVASNPSTPADVLQDLVGETEQIRWEAATNKNARMQDTVRAARIPRKEANWGYGWDYEEALARHSTAFAQEITYCSCKDAEILRVLANSVFPNFRERVARNPFAPPDALKHLAEDKDHRVACAVGENAAANSDALQVLAKRSDSSLRKLVAEAPSATPSLLRQLSGDKKATVREAVAAHPSTPPDVLERLAQDRAMLDIDGNTGRSPFGLEPLVRMAVAQNTSTPPKVLRKLAADSDSMVRYLVATNPATPGAVLRTLKTDQDEEIAEQAVKRLKSGRAGSRRRPKPVAKKAKSPQKTQKLREVDAILAGLPGVAHLVVAEYVHDRRVRVRSRLAGNPLLPEKHQVRMAKDSAPSVRKALAENPGVSDSVLSLLEEDSDKAVAKLAKAQLRKRDRLRRSSPRAASRPRRPSAPKRSIRRSLPPPRKADLSRLGDWQHLAALPSIERSRVARLDDIPERKREAKRKELAEAFIEKYSRTNRPSFKRLLCLLLPECPIPALAMAARSTDWKERLAVAAHPKTPPGIRKQLAKDGNELVRAAARDAVSLAES